MSGPWSAAQNHRHGHPVYMLTLVSVCAQKWEDDAFYVWRYELPTSPWFYVGAGALVVLVLMLCLFPLAPYQACLFHLIGFWIPSVPHMRPGPLVADDRTNPLLAPGYVQRLHHMCLDTTLSIVVNLHSFTFAKMGEERV